MYSLLLFSFHFVLSVLRRFFGSWVWHSFIGGIAFIQNEADRVHGTTCIQNMYENNIAGAFQDSNGGQSFRNHMANPMLYRLSSIRRPYLKGSHVSHSFSRVS